MSGELRGDRQPRWFGDDGKRTDDRSHDDGKPLHEEDGRRAKKPITVAIRGKRYDHDADFPDELCNLIDKHLHDATSGARAALFADVHALIWARDRAEADR